LSAPEAAILRVMNQTRTLHGLQRLTVDRTLHRAARAHSSAMLRRDFFSHGDFISRIRRFGARGPAFGENLAWGTGPYSSARTIVARWLASPGHRAILLRPGFERVGVGAAVGEFLGYPDATLVTADFAGR
jgi:uncharacterized protein YkwD